MHLGSVRVFCDSFFIPYSCHCIMKGAMFYTYLNISVLIRKGFGWIAISVLFGYLFCVKFCSIVFIHFIEPGLMTIKMILIPVIIPETSSSCRHTCVKLNLLSL